ncbi:unnamed protein product [Prunus armeniaca]
MEIRRDRNAGNLWLSQSKYISKVLEKFNMMNCKPVSTPLAEHFKLSAQEFPSTNEEKEEMSKAPYASLVGCLMYAMVCTRLSPSRKRGVKVHGESRQTTSDSSKVDSHVLEGHQEVLDIV